MGPTPVLGCRRGWLRADGVVWLWEHISVKFKSEFYNFHSRKCIWDYRLPKWRPFCPGGDELNGCYAIYLNMSHVSVEYSWPSKNPIELIFIAKVYFIFTSSRDSATSHHKHPFTQDMEKLARFWSRYFGNESDYWQLVLVFWEFRDVKRKYFDK